MKISVIMLTKTADENFRIMTANAIQSLRIADDYDFDIHVVESGDRRFGPYPNTSTHLFEGEWGYNSALNLGFEKAKENGLGEYVILANNDLIFHKNWLATSINRMIKCDLDSSSPVNPGWQPHQEIMSRYPGWEAIGDWNIGVGFCGWLQVYSRKAICELMPLPEEIKFWCADNYAAHRGQTLGHRHGLICEAQVQHLTSSSHKLIPEQLKYEWTDGQAQVLNKVLENG